jgi:hypothetical protein
VKASVRSPHVWIAVASATGVLSLALVDTGRTSPGELAAVHQREPDLAGRSGCAGCHGSWRKGMSEACLECHATIAEQIDLGEGLHGALTREETMRCARCHSEHHGTSFAIVNAQSFFQAGVPDPEEFDHGMVGFEMEGRHLELGCAECHTQAYAMLLPIGTHRYIGLDAECAACHEDPHEGRMALGCVDCHDQVSFENHRYDQHADSLPLVGGHGDLTCRTCHAESEPHALEALGRKTRGLTARECLDCHESPHRDAFVSGVAALLERTFGATCGDCHVAEHTSFRAEGLTVSAPQHAQSGFPLEVPHEGLQCAECHDPGAPDFAARHPGRLADGCHACHEDPHGAQFEAGPFGDQGCLACHDRHHFEPHAFTVELHELAALRLDGSHLATDCNECHALPEDGGPRVFHGTPARCELCHADAHRGYFEGFASELASATAGECALCHLTTQFAELPPAGFDHGRWTGFPLRGAHEQDGCESCHPRSTHPDPHGRSFGFVAEHFGKVEGCVTCHPDPHGGHFDEPDQPAEVDGKTGCARCHDETSFRNLPGGFDHALWTGYPLDGAHAELGCLECHQPERRPGVPGLARGAARGTLCADCHADPHASQFVRGATTRCESCHQSALAWSDLGFNHSLDSRFPLDEAHAVLECSACHHPVSEGGREFVRYKPLGRECADCHGDAAGPKGRRNGGRR